MRSHKKSILVLRIKGQRPDSQTRQAMFFRIDPGPRQASIGGVVNAAAVLATLISVAGKKLVAVPRIYEDAGEVSEGQIATAT